MKLIYIVFGSTGEYSDRTEWPILAVASEDRAQRLITDLDRVAREHGVSDNHPRRDREQEAIAAICAVVAGAVPSYIDYTGVSFYYAGVPLEEPS